MAPPSTAPGRSWQPILGAVLVIAGLIVGVIAIIALSQPSGQRSTTATRQTGSPDDTTGASSGTPSAPATGGPAARAAVIVLNATAIPGLASTASADLTAGGWTVTATDNYSSAIDSTTAYYDPSSPANQAAATQLQREFPWVVRVIARIAGLPASPIVLVLSATY
jgi:hypothetical protein